MTLGFVYYLIYLTALIGSAIAAPLLIWKRRFETLSLPVLVFILSIIGLSANWGAFLRCFAGMYGIEFGG